MATVNDITTLAFLGNLGVGELVLILVIVLIIFGAGKLPQLGDALGKGIKNFRSATRGAADEGDDKAKADAAGELPPRSADGVAKVEDVEARDVTRN